MTQTSSYDIELAREQEHLTHIYEELRRMYGVLTEKLNAIARDAAADKDSMAEELTYNGTSFDEMLETYAAIESANKVIEGYNMAADTASRKLSDLSLLLHQPYFAKVRLRYLAKDEVRELYIGAAGATDDEFKRLVVDWRSPVAEVYYNQANGRTSYEANGRTIEVDLELRRQFDIERDTLKAFFDTTVAIEDPLLLQSLSETRSQHMKAITTTIQREQNTVIRHEDVPALLVSGVAGSGKTSVLLQRIAYLFYRHRDDLSPDKVHLITPNPVFSTYIQNVLPEMGERNPRICTWNELACTLLPEGRGPGKGEVGLERLRSIDAGIPHLELTHRDFNEIRCGKVTFITTNQIDSLFHRFANVPMGPRRVTLVREELLKKFEQRLKRMAATDAVIDELSDLSIEEQLRIFHETVNPQTEGEERELALRLLRDRYEQVRVAIEHDQWLDIGIIGMQLLESTGIAPLEWLYTKMALTGLSDPDARFVMIDEVQDYTEAQLACLARYFSRAKFMLLGDENQAIQDDATTFESIRKVFEAHGKAVSRCDLMISYRSTPQITALFARLAHERGMEIQSVHPDGEAPRIRTFADADARTAELTTLIAEAREREGLTAIIVPWKHHLKGLAKAHADLTIVDDQAKLPERGVFATTLKLAKGLEFDAVILPDVSAAVYPEGDASRRRLYTAISRATQEVTLLSAGTITPWLAEA